MFHIIHMSRFKIWEPGHDNTQKQTLFRDFTVRITLSFRSTSHTRESEETFS